MRTKRFVFIALAVAFVLLMGVRYALGSTWARAGVAAIAGAAVGAVICVAAARGHKRG